MFSSCVPFVAIGTLFVIDNETSNAMIVGIFKSLQNERRFIENKCQLFYTRNLGFILTKMPDHKIRTRNVTKICLWTTTHNLQKSRFSNQTKIIDANEMSSQAMSIIRLAKEQCICGSVELDRIGLTIVTTRKITYNGNILI